MQGLYEIELRYPVNIVRNFAPILMLFLWIRNQKGASIARAFSPKGWSR
jgi:hypothetical protein